MGIFVESEIKFSKKIAIKPGLRGEYGTLLKQASISPRFALAVKTGKGSQLSGAWGIYYQNPEFDYLKFNSKLNLEKATHYILGFQSGNLEERLFRTEAYYKTYNNLITWEGSNKYYPQHIANNGNGYARGIDIFWRDRKSIKYFEYWLTYSLSIQNGNTKTIQKWPPPILFRPTTLLSFQNTGFMPSPRKLGYRSMLLRAVITTTRQLLSSWMLKQDGTIA